MVLPDYAVAAAAAAAAANAGPGKKGRGRSSVVESGKENGLLMKGKPLDTALLITMGHCEQNLMCLSGHYKATDKGRAFSMAKVRSRMRAYHAVHRAVVATSSAVWRGHFEHWLSAHLAQKATRGGAPPPPRRSYRGLLSLTEFGALLSVATDAEAFVADERELVASFNAWEELAGEVGLRVEPV